MSKTAKTVYDVVVALVADYGRMKRLLEKGNITRDQAIFYAKSVAAIDNALIAVCRGEPHEVVEALREDIAERHGFERATSRAYYNTHYVYNKRKCDAVDLMAKMLNLKKKLVI